MVETRRLKELVSSTLSRLELTPTTAEVALSGGADSAALAFLALQAGADVSALHVDHQLPASSMMAAAAAAVAAQLAIEIETHTVHVSDGPSPEEQARVARYELFAGRGGPILTGHTRDDSVETVIINLIRGTGPGGLSGIPRLREPNIHRPMLAITRSETRELATLARLPFVDDPMNEDLSLTRNRVRLELLPRMRELNPRVDEAIARTADILDRDRMYFEELVEDRMGRPLPVSVLATMPRAIADRVILRFLEESGVGATADRILRVWSVARAESDRQELAEGRVVVRRGALLVIE